MAKSASERRAQRDAYARQVVNPTTGQPFKNYNALDTYQRNEKSRQRGFASRAQQRYQQERQRDVTLTTNMPNSFQNFLGGREPSVKLKSEFERAFGPGAVTAARMAARADYFDSEYSGDWVWREWREEYAAA